MPHNPLIKNTKDSPPVEIRSHPSSGNKEDNFGVTPPVEIKSHPQWKLRVTPPVEIRSHPSSGNKEDNLRFRVDPYSGNMYGDSKV